MEEPSSLQVWSPLLCAASDAAAVAATAKLIDLMTPGGAAIGIETATLVEAVTSDLLTSHRYRANVLAVLLWPAHVLGAWARAVAAGGGIAHADAVALALDEKRVAAHLSQLTLEIADPLADQDPQARGMQYQFIATCTHAPQQVLPSLLRAAQCDVHPLARASALESVLIALARLAPGRAPEAERRLASQIRDGAIDVQHRLKHGLDWLGWMGLQEAGQAVLDRLALDVLPGDESLWPVEAI